MGWKFRLCSQLLKKNKWEMKTEIEFWICIYGNGKALMGRGCQRVALSYVFHRSRGIIAGIEHTRPKRHPGCSQFRAKVWNTRANHRHAKKEGQILCFLLSPILLCLFRLQVLQGMTVNMYFSRQKEQRQAKIVVWVKRVYQMVEQIQLWVYFYLQITHEMSGKGLWTLFQGFCNQNLL